MLNWFVWNRTVYLYKNGFGINDKQGWYAINPNKQTKINLSNQKKFLQNYGRAKIQTFFSEWSNQWNNVLKNWYISLTITQADYHKCFQLKLVFGEYM